MIPMATFVGFSDVNHERVMLLPDPYSPVIDYGSSLAEGLPPQQTNFTAILQEVQVRTYLSCN